MKQKGIYDFSDTIRPKDNGLGGTGVVQADEAASKIQAEKDPLSQEK